MKEEGQGAKKHIRDAKLKKEKGVRVGTRGWIGKAGGAAQRTRGEPLPPPSCLGTTALKREGEKSLCVCRGRGEVSAGGVCVAEAEADEWMDVEDGRTGFEGREKRKGSGDEEGKKKERENAKRAAGNIFIRIYETDNIRQIFGKCVNVYVNSGFYVPSPPFFSREGRRWTDVTTCE